MKRFIFIPFLLLLLSLQPFQSVAVNTDSLQRVLSTAVGEHRIEILNTLSWELKFGDPQKGKQYALESIHISEKQQDEKGLMLAYRNLAAIMYVQGKTDSSLHYAQLARQFAEKTGDKFQLGKALNLIAINYENISNFNKSMEFQDKALAIFRELGDSTEIYGNLHNKAILYESVNDYITAYELYKQILEYELRINNDLGICRTALQIGTIADLNEDYYNAEKYYRLSIEYAEKVNNMRWKSAALNDIAGMYQKQDSFDLAMKLYNQALQINRQHGFTDYEANNLTNMADLYADLDSKRSIDYYRKAAAIFKAQRDLLSLSRIKLSLADLMLKNGKPDTAKTLALQALSHADSLGFPSIMRSANLSLYEISRKQGNIEEALEYLEANITWRNKLENDAGKEKLSKLQSRYDFQKMEKENSALQAQNELQDLDNKQQRIVLFVLLGVGFLLVIFAAVLIMGRRKLKTLNEELDRKNNQVQKQADMLQQALSTKDKFFSIIAHDLKNPFMGIMGFSELLVEKSEEYEDEDLKVFASAIHKSSNNLFELLENLLAWAKSQRGDFEIDLKKLDLFEETQKVVEQLRWNAQNKNVEIEHNIQAGTTVYSDKNVLQTLSRNLLYNAIKYSQPDSKIDFGSMEKENEVIVYVKDDGIGISKDMQNSIFEICSNKVVAGTQKETGTGLGLVLCKELIEKQGGKIWFESSPNNGSTFYFSLPKTNKSWTQEQKQY